MKIVIEEKQSKEVEISLPYFFKDGGAYYRILTETDITRVSIVDECVWCSKSDIMSVNPSKGEQITEQEFDEYMEKALELIQVKQVA
jgi:hypothetical protein